MDAEDVFIRDLFEEISALGHDSDLIHYPKAAYLKHPKVNFLCIDCVALCKNRILEHRALSNIRFIFMRQIATEENSSYRF